ncbi:MAG TPA: PhnD/SsuA/transferrin family substrate-binding protein [Casimicrobiaceae bacterium]|nr:PhnD/SsuA/transferrin family substrate-binding protein [Casimicrobiaceae bacterium]
MRIANARMYSVNASAAEAWRTLLRWVIDRAGVDAEVIDYPPPQPLPALWARSDLACAFMCGYPISQASAAPAVLAAPVPSAPAYRGRPEYWTNVVARSDGPVRTLEEALGRRMAYTAPDSQSGYQALRSLLAPYARERGVPLFASMVGPLITPARVVESVLAGDADAGPVDSYAFELMKHHEPARLAALTIVATTSPTPIPPLVGAANLPPEDAARWRAALLSVAAAGELAAVRGTLLLRGFAPATVAHYDVLREAAEAATTAGYATLE